MELFIAKLAVATIPLLLLVATVTVLNKRTRKGFIVLCRANRRHHPVWRAFGTAASLRWF
jgi:hypothetical protein